MEGWVSFKGEIIILKILAVNAVNTVNAEIASQAINFDNIYYFCLISLIALKVNFHN